MDIKQLKTTADKYKINQFSKRHFRDIDIKELINHYREYECLWNFNSPDYKNKSLKQEAWTDIANYFHKDVNEVKRKIKYLRTAYVAEKKKVDSSKSGVDSAYKPSLFYYKDFDFLDSVVVWRKFSSEQGNNELEFENVQIDPEAEEDEMVSFSNKEDVDLKLPEVQCKSESLSERSYSPLPQTQVKNSPKILSTRSLATRPLKRKLNKNIKACKILNKSVSPANNKLSDNLYISFGKTIALQLQQLPLDVAILTMSEIHSILTRKTLEYIKYIQNEHDSSSHSESEGSYTELMEDILDDTC